ncbi:MAG: CTP synthase [Patescibacteria group bacterium]|jgi:CTP synthase
MNFPKDTKFIFVTGGVCSGLGKGLAAASIGALLKAAKLNVFSLKLDPYLNVDPGTMNPYQHGEVFVLDDGTETDLDLGHYERFLDVSLSKLSNVTSGQIYQNVLNRERKGEFLGKTIQIIPHITDHIHEHIARAAKESEADVLIMEIGGTVGDIEGEPYLEAARQMHHKLGNERVLFVHVSLLAYLKTSNELKTKPTQASVRELRRLGVQPDIILLRTDYPINGDIIKKVSLFCDVPPEAVIPAPTLKNIYDVPLQFEKKKISKIIFDHFGINKRLPDMSKWVELSRKAKDGKYLVSVGIIGKYTALGDAYLSVLEALKAASYAEDVKLSVVWLDAEKLEKKNGAELKKLKSVQGILVPGGFGVRGTEGKIMAAKYARENNIPYLGLCLGMQIAAIEFARNVLENKKATSGEFDPDSKDQVIHIIPEQEKKLLQQDYGATMRLGSWECVLVKGTKTAKAYNEHVIHERHRHRYEFNNVYREEFENNGMKIAGTTPDGELVEILELKKHPWFVGVQFHPELKSRPINPHPLFRGFIQESKKLGKKIP